MGDQEKVEPMKPQEPEEDPINAAMKDAVTAIGEAAKWRNAGDRLLAERFLQRAKSEITTAVKLVKTG